MVAKANKNGNGDKNGTPDHTQTVTVCCKWPNGLILQLSEFAQVDEQTSSGVRSVRLSHRVGPQVHIKGYATPWGQLPKGPIVGGYALTHGVSREFWEMWCQQNAGCDLLKNEILFAHVQPASVESFAKSNESLRNGVEPIDPNAPRGPGLKHPNIRLEKENRHDDA